MSARADMQLRQVTIDGVTLVRAVRSVEGRSVIYEARTALDQKRAIKVLWGDSDDAQDQLLAEARAAACLDAHPNVVRVHDVGVAREGSVYLEMEWIAGPTLQQRLVDGVIQPSEAIDIVLQIASALRHLHLRGIVHRDIKPSNIMLERDASGRVRAVLIDFGIASEIARYVTKRGVVVGTPGYMAPEQCEGRRKIDGQADVYALGLVLYEMLTGVPACDDQLSDDAQIDVHLSGNLNLSLLSNVPEGLAALVKSMVKQHSAQRLSLQRVIERLRAVAHNMSGSSRSWWRRTWRRSMVVAISALLTSVVAVFGWSATYRARLFRTSASGMAAFTGGQVRISSGPSRLDRVVQLLRQNDRPQALIDLVVANLTPQQERSFYVAPFLLEIHEVTWQQFANWLNTLWGISTRPELDGGAELDRYIVDANGDLILDNTKSDKHGCWLERGLFGAWKAKTGCEGVPVERFRFYAARAYCSALGRKLMSEPQYDFAVRNVDERAFLWGHDWPACGTSMVFDEVTHPKDSDSYVEGVVPSCPNPHPEPQDVRRTNRIDVVNGVVDLFGNLAELTSTPYVNRDDPNAHQVIERGSSYTLPAEFGITSFRVFVDVGPEHADLRIELQTITSGYGFRCGQ